MHKNGITKEEFFKRAAGTAYHVLDEEDFREVGLSSKLKFVNRRIFANVFRDVYLYLVIHVIKKVKSESLSLDFISFLYGTDVKMGEYLTKEFNIINEKVTQAATFPAEYPNDPNNFYYALSAHILTRVYPRSPEKAQRIARNYLYSRLAELYLNLYSIVASEVIID